MTGSVSVAVACHNAAKYIDRAIESALNQTRAPEEVIVVDDGSSDHSLDVVSRYPVRCIRLPDRRGASAARNQAVLGSTGEFIAILDADDWWEPNHLETVAGMLDRFPDAVVAYGGVRLVGTRSGLWIPFGTPGEPFDPFWSLVRKKGQPPHPATVIRREALLKAGGYDVSLEGSHDYDLWLRLADTGKFVYSGGASLNYRIHSEQLSANPLRQLLEDYAALGKLKRGLAEVRDHRVERLERELLLRWRQDNHKYWNGGFRDGGRVLEAALERVALRRSLWVRVWSLLWLCYPMYIRSIKVVPQPIRRVVARLVAGPS